MVELIFNHPRLASIYDHFDGSREDLYHHSAILAELGAVKVLDIGCGTGTFACLLADRGFEVVAVDPAAASLEIARSKDGADRVTWHEGDATTLPPMQVDTAIMTGNVAQVFLSDEDFLATLRAARAVLRPGGHVVFEVRDPTAHAWLEWTPSDTGSRVEVPGEGHVQGWCEVTDVDDDLVSFRWTYVFEEDATVLQSDSTLRFRSRGEVEELLRQAGFEVVEVRDAPDRPGKEFVFIAVR